MTSMQVEAGENEELYLRQRLVRAEHFIFHVHDAKHCYFVTGSW